MSEQSASRQDMLALSVREFVAAAAAKTPTPGGGSVAGVVGALVAVPGTGVVKALVLHLQGRDPTDGGDGSPGLVERWRAHRSRGGGVPAAAPGERLWQHYEADAYRRWSGLPVAEGIVRQLSELPDGLARDWVEPGSGADKHRAYAFQWFAMSGTAALAALVLAWRTVRRPR